MHLADPHAQWRPFYGPPDSPFLAPRGVHLGANRLLVSDTGQNRVFLWHQLPTETHQAPDVVLGQENFIGNAPNGQGVGRAPSAQSLYWPYGLTSDGTRLCIADTGNRRVLVFDDIPTTSFAAADHVIGQENFTERDYDHRHAIWPYSVKIGPAGQLAITDTQYYRVLLWAHWKQAVKHASPPTLVGQPDRKRTGKTSSGRAPGIIP